MKNKSLFLIGVLLIASMILSACGGGAVATEAPKPAANTPVPSGGGSTGGGAPAEGSPVVDPANAGGKARTAASYLYEGLVSEQGGSVVGMLAESYQVSDDGLDYIFNLRSGVTFHDGATLNADLVIANFNRWFDPADANRGSGAYEAWAKNFGGFKGETKEDGKPKSHYDGIEKVNDFTVLIHLNEPDADFVKKLTDPAFFISSPAGFTGGDGGSGPYKLAGGDSATAKIEPFSGYWNPAAVPASGMDVPLK